MASTSSANVTTDHNAIRRWAEERKGRPSTVEATGDEEKPGILRLDFPQFEDNLTKISWDEFFQKFDEADLAFLHQDRTADGKMSRFHKFVHRETAKSKSH